MVLRLGAAQTTQLLTARGEKTRISKLPVLAFGRWRPVGGLRTPRGLERLLQVAARLGQVLGSLLSVEHKPAPRRTAKLVFHAVERLQPLGDLVGEVVGHARPSFAS